MKTSSLTISVSPAYAAIIRNFRKAGRYPTNAGVVHAALCRLQDTEWDPDAYPPGSLAHLYTPSRNREERMLNQVSTLMVNHDD
ncbi:MAG: hypothetical protein HY043_09850 [Verrucomicrobia bacterium]|nr:hypothetical protein [Verrucomicrobiota bacterium]